MSDMGKGNGIVCKTLEVFPFCSLAYCTSYLQLLRVMQPSKCHKVFAWSPLGNQLVWFRETFLQNQVTSSKILGAIMENGPNLEGCDEAYGHAIVEVGAGDIHNPLISCP